MPNTYLKRNCPDNQKYLIIVSFNTEHTSIISWLAISLYYSPTVFGTYSLCHMRYTCTVLYSLCHMSCICCIHVQYLKFHACFSPKACSKNTNYPNHISMLKNIQYHIILMFRVDLWLPYLWLAITSINKYLLVTF